MRSSAQLQEAAACFKQFFGSSFLSDFTLVIRSEGPPPTTPPATAPPPAPPEASAGSGAAAAAAAGSAAPPNVTAPAAGALQALQLSALREPSDPASPCSGQRSDAPPSLSEADAAASAARSAGSPYASPFSSPYHDHQQPAPAPAAPASAAPTVSADAAADAAAAAGGAAVEVPVHGVVLAAASPYFEMLLREWKRPAGAGAGAGGGSNVLHMVVGEEQLAAAQVLVGFMYQGTLPPALPQHDLLQLLLLADRFDVAGAAAAACRALGCLTPASLEWPTLLGIWGLPDHLLDAEEQRPLRAVALERLTQLFGDLEVAWATADGHAQWAQLPLRAVVALAGSDGLAASENTVFAALSSWIAAAAAAAAPHGRGLGAHELRTLAASVRLPSMGPCYLAYVALQHQWFRCSLDVGALARSAAFAAAGAEVRKDMAAHTASTTSALLAAATAACGTGPGDALAAGACTAAAQCCGCSGSRCGAGQQQLQRQGACCSGGAGAGASASGSCCGCCCPGQCARPTPEQQAQLLVLAQAAQRPRALSARQSCCFSWPVDLAAIRQLHQEVATAGSRDSKIMRSPAHVFAGYEWALQLEVTQTKGLTGFDPSKPWSLGVFLTCQVRMEVPGRAAAAAPPLVADAGAGRGGAADGEAAAAGDGAGLPRSRAASSSGGRAGGGSQPHQPLLQRQPQHQLLDFGFVSTQATIGVREVGNKRCEKSWEHAVVRHRASWGWPSFLEVQIMGWDPSQLERWVLDGQLLLTATVRVLG